MMIYTEDQVYKKRPQEQKMNTEKYLATFFFTVLYANNELEERFKCLCKQCQKNQVPKNQLQKTYEGFMP